jgi:hypothetical protein
MSSLNLPTKSPASPSLGTSLILESACAIVSALSVAPIISIVNKAIVYNTSGLEPLVPCFLNGFKQLFFKPIHFFKQPSFLFIWGVYSGTYIVANCTESLCEHYQRSSFYPKFFASSFTNVSLSVLKDKAFARMFGVGTPKPLPSLSYLLFATRDSATIFASFTITGPISSHLQSCSTLSPAVCDTLTQLLTPITMQIFSTPLHLYGLDICNRQEKGIPLRNRLEFIQKEYVKTVLARMARIFPAFGIGGVLNKKVRTWSKETFF